MSERPEKSLSTYQLERSEMLYEPLSTFHLKHEKIVEFRNNINNTVSSLMSEFNLKYWVQAISDDGLSVTLRLEFKFFSIFACKTRSHAARTRFARVLGVRVQDFRKLANCTPESVQCVRVRKNPRAVIARAWPNTGPRNF